MEYWIVVGLFCLLIEFTKLPGIGFLFLGLGGLTNAILVYNFEYFVQYQYASFGILSLMWLVILWFPLKKYVYKTNKNQQDYSSDIIGAQVEVLSSELNTLNIGQVKWSGTIMNAKLDEEEQGPAKAKDILKVKKVHGSILICTRL